MLLTACWNPSVKEVPITAPWDKMNLPVKADARVYKSTDKELKVAHKASKNEVAKAYLEALEKDGWKFMGKPAADVVIWDFEKNTQRMSLNVYDFENTGVILEIK
jgi:hypothetical protein